MGSRNHSADNEGEGSVTETEAQTRQRLINRKLKLAGWNVLDPSQVIQELDELLETGFSGREVGRVEEMIKGLNELESETDQLAERAQRKLFAMENELGISTVFWYELINWVGVLADHAERVGNRLRLLIAS